MSEVVHINDDALDTMEVLRWLNDTDKKNFLALEAMFGTDGWKLVMEHADKMSTYNGIAGADASSWDSNRIAYGARAAWDAVLRLEDSLMNQYAMAADSAKAAAEEVEDDYVAEML